MICIINFKKAWKSFKKKKIRVGHKREKIKCRGGSEPEY